jgi:hypothetical protein
MAGLSLVSPVSIEGRSMNKCEVQRKLPATGTMNSRARYLVQVSPELDRLVERHRHNEFPSALLVLEH